MSSTPNLDSALQIARSNGMEPAAWDRACDELRAMRELLSGKTLYDARQATLMEIASYCEEQAQDRPADSAALHAVAAECFRRYSHAAGWIVPKTLGCTKTLRPRPGIVYPADEFQSPP
jgi:hypothetical protein